MGVGKTETVDLKYYAPRFSISINDGKPEELPKYIISVQVNEKINAPAEANISVSDEIRYTGQKTLRFRWLDNDLFQVGNRVKVEMGYAGQLQEMIAGNIIRLESSFFSGGAPTLTLVVRDALHIITKKPSSELRKYFNKKRNVTDSDIAYTIWEFIIWELINDKLEVKLREEIDKTKPKYRKVLLPSNTTFYDFLKQRADRIYFEFYIRNNVFYFIEPRTEKAEVKTLRWHKDLISFKPNISSAELVTAVKVKSRSSSTGKNIEGVARMGTEKAQENRKQLASMMMTKFYGEAKEITREITNIPVYTKAEAEMIARAQLNKASDTLITGDAETIGIPEIRPGVNVKLEGLGKWFTGKYYVVEATHTIDSNGYRTKFKVRRNAL